MFISTNARPVLYWNLWCSPTFNSCRDIASLDEREEGVNLKSIGIFGLAQIPYTLKFLWAPLIDRFSIPFFDRRRGWMALSQLVIGLLLFTLVL